MQNKSEREPKGHACTLGRITHAHSSCAVRMPFAQGHMSCFVKSIRASGNSLPLFTQGAVSWHRVWWVPSPQPADAPPTVFSEARAMAHVRVLSEDIGQRGVSVGVYCLTDRATWD